MMRKISYKFNLLLILSVTVSVLISSLATTTYLLYTSEKDTHEKNLVHIKGLADNISSFLDHATTLNYQLSLNSQIVNSLLMADPQWDNRVKSYNRLYNTSG